MASPILLFLVPNCGLSIEIEQKLELDDGEARKFKFSNPDQFSFHDDSKKEVFEGWMSPIKRVSLPSAHKKAVGVPQAATQFAYLHPHANLAKNINWSTFQPRELRNEDSTNFRSKSLGAKTFSSTSFRSTSFRARENQDPLLLTTNYFAIPYVAMLGGFAYFDDECKLICVTAISLQRTPYSLRLLGPFEPTEHFVSDLTDLNRLHVMPLGIFHEAGLVASAWVHSMENIQSEQLTDCFNNKDGGFLFLREDGSAISYVVEPTGHIENTGDIESLSDACRTAKKILDDGTEKSEDNNSSSFSATYGSMKSPDIVSESVSKATQKLYHFVSDYKKIDENQDEVLALRDLTKSSTTLADVSWKIIDVHKDCRTETLIHIACHLCCNSELIRLLINETEEANLFHKDQYGWLPLHYACRFNPHLELISLLVEKCPEAVLQPDRFGRYPIHIACMANAPVEVIFLLLDVDKKNIATFKKTKLLGWLPLHVACARGVSTDVVRKLLFEDKDGETIATKTVLGALPLHFAIRKKMPEEAIRLLIEKDTTQPALDVKKKDFKLAFVKGMMGRSNLAFDNIAADLSLNSDEDIYQKYDGMLPLHIACRNQSSEGTVSLLLKKDRAMRTIDEEISTETSLLLSEDEEIDILSPLSELSVQGMQPLHLAVKFGSSSDVVRLLLQKEKQKKKKEKNPLLSRDVLGRCPLHYACYQNRGIEIVEFLIDSDPTKESTQYKDLKGYMPIHYLNLGDKNATAVTKALLDAEESFRQLKNKPQSKKSTHTLFGRKTSLLSSAVQHGAPDEVLELLLQPEHFTLKGLDDVLLWNLALRSSTSPTLQALIVEKLSDRVRFSLLFFDFYTNFLSVTAFLEGTDRLLIGESRLTEPLMIYCCVFLFFIREMVQIKSQGSQYLADTYSWLEIIRMCFLTSSASYMIHQIGVDKPFIPKELLITTGVMVIVQFIFFLRSTFLPFARFVGGLLMIFRTLIPFFIVSNFVLLAFAYSFLLEDGGPNAETCLRLKDCYFFVLQGFFSGGDETKDMLDILFGIIVIIILLNIVIAIVCEAWDTAAEAASALFWNFRLEFLSETRYVGNLFHRETEAAFSRYLNSFPTIRIKDSILWTDEPYNIVSSEEEYLYPHEFFDSDIADKILKVHSLSADLYWCKRSEKDGGPITQLRYALIFVKWSFLALIYMVLIVLGFFCGGMVWPRDFRRAVLFAGIERE